MFCFATPESPGGLYINLSSHQAFDEAHLPLDQQRSGAALYLHQQARRVSRRLFPRAVAVPHQVLQ